MVNEIFYFRATLIIFLFGVFMATHSTARAQYPIFIKKTDKEVGYECISGYGERKCGYGCAKAYGQLQCGSRAGERCVAAYGQIRCGFNCEAKYGDIQCAAFPPDQPSVGLDDNGIIIQINPRGPYRKGKRNKTNADISQCPEKRAPLGACDEFTSETIFNPKHMGCTQSGSHVWMCKSNDIKPPYPVIVCPTWNSDDCVKMSESW